jgi:hypothetical protein
MLPFVVGFEVMSDGGLVSGSDYSLKVLMLKESVMTPDVDLMDDGELVMLEDESVALGSADSEVDFNFIEEMKFEKLYMMYLLY